MQSEEIDNRIREAAEHHHPAYDEQAWTKMEQLLDKHLPQKEDDRRRFIFFLLLFLLIGGGIASLLLTGKKRNNGHSIATLPLTVYQNAPATPGNNNSSAKEPVTQEEVAINPQGESSTPNNTTGNITVPSSLLPGDFRHDGFKQIPGKKQKSNITPLAPGEMPGNDVGKNKATNVIVANDNPGSGLPAAAGNNTVVVKTSANEPGVKEIPVTLVDTKKLPAINEPVKKEETMDREATAQKPVKLKNKRSSSFSLNFSAGPDMSMVGSGKTGRTKLLSGIGLGYTYKDRLTIRTGFYTANKVYTAAPTDYHPSNTNFYYYYPNLQKIDADCKVYEIPISLSYNFGHTRKQNWFASSGVSTYLMKRETYNYFYKRSPGESTINRERTLNGVNKHYFAVMTVSVGYQRHLNKAMTLTVEPYLKLPLKGVGYGKVKLNSSGVLFTVGIKPFALFKKERK
ncbi:MAG: hypothetical protein ABIT05_10550 [Chitinophagaceae bacterium]